MYEDLLEKKLRSENIYDGVLLHVRRDTVTLPNGREAVREWVRHPGASAVLPVFEDGTVLLVRQYRYPVDRVTLEIPAGKLDSPKELSEETGYTAKHWEKLTTIGTTVGFSNEYIHIYAAHDLQAGEQHTDDDEFIHVVKMPLEEAVERVKAGEIFDAKSVTAILMTAFGKAKH